VRNRVPLHGGLQPVVQRRCVPAHGARFISSMARGWEAEQEAPSLGKLLPCRGTASSMTAQTAKRAPLHALRVLHARLPVPNETSK
jgi:hypothetical protein